MCPANDLGFAEGASAVRRSRVCASWLRRTWAQPDEEEMSMSAVASAPSIQTPPRGRGRGGGSPAPGYESRGGRHGNARTGSANRRAGGQGARTSTESDHGADQRGGAAHTALAAPLPIER